MQPLIPRSLDHQPRRPDGERRLRITDAHGPRKRSASSAFPDLSRLRGAANCPPAPLPSRRPQRNRRLARSLHGRPRARRDCLALREDGEAGDADGSCQRNSGRRAGASRRRQGGPSSQRFRNVRAAAPAAFACPRSPQSKLPRSQKLRTPGLAAALPAAALPRRLHGPPEVQFSRKSSPLRNTARNQCLSVAIWSHAWYRFVVCSKGD